MPSLRTQLRADLYGASLRSLALGLGVCLLVALLQRELCRRFTPGAETPLLATASAIVLTPASLLLVHALGVWAGRLQRNGADTRGLRLWGRPTLAWVDVTGWRLIAEPDVPGGHLLLVRFAVQLLGPAGFALLGPGALVGWLLLQRGHGRGAALADAIAMNMLTNGIAMLLPLPLVFSAGSR